MKKTIVATIGAAALLLTAACGSSDDSADEVEEVEIIEVEETTASASPSAELPVDEDGNLDEDAFDEQLADETAVTESLTEVMDRVGVPAGQQATVNMWAPTACQMAQAMGVSDSEAAGFMVTDLEGQVDLTEDQAAEIWAVAKTTC